MNAIEVRGLAKNFGSRQALCGLDMTVPAGSVYGLIGENGCGKSTTQKIICGLVRPSAGTVRLFGRDCGDEDVRARLGVLIESPGCFPDQSVWDNLMLQAANLRIPRAKDEVARALKTVRMEGSAANAYKNCSLGMKQRVGIAMALLGNPALLVLDEPINGLDADGMRLMREILEDITADGRCSVLISSHLLGELEKVATHYGIMRGGKMIREMTAAELEADCRTYVAVRARDMVQTRAALCRAWGRVEEEEGHLRIYDAVAPEEVVAYLYENGILVNEVWTDKISLEEYYIDLMNDGKGR